MDEENGFYMNKHSKFCVQDPFDLSHNVAKVVDSRTLRIIRSELIRAYILLVNGDIWKTLEVVDETHNSSDGDNTKTSKENLFQ
jgi:hypothetical protein